MGLGWTLHGEVPSCSSLPQRASPWRFLQRNTPLIFLLCVIFLFYIGKENFLDTRPFRETL